jgi:4-amino-4-deoxy-L-arabinose transferase-like glycosyltransferase
MRSQLWSAPALAGLWLGLLIVALSTSPLLPIDGTRYASVAWEMWQRGEFLVPYLNGAPYSHKPPLLFWLIQLGWALLGVNEWWPRLVSPFAALGAMALTGRLARLLWPDTAEAARFAPWVLFGTAFWAGFYTWLQLDMLVVLCALLGLLGVATAWRGSPRGWWVTGLALGLGLLSKGPVILLHVMPVALLAPLWVEKHSAPAWPRWYAGCLLSVVLGALIALAWALPAASAGGADYGRAIFWGQTADRLVDSFAHAHPWWWYLPWLPLFFAPWSLWPSLWIAGLRAGNFSADSGGRLCLVWLLTAVVIFSLISGKQLKYLLPLQPAFALLVARGVTRTPDGRPAVAPHAGVLGTQIVLLGLVLIVLPLVRQDPLWLTGISPVWGALLLLGGGAVALCGRIPARRLIIMVTFSVVLVVVVVRVGVFTAAAPAYDLHQVSHLIGEAQRWGRPVANLARYHGQYQFLGRLTEPLQVVSRGNALRWARENPDGLLLVYERNWGGPVSTAVWSQPYRGGGLVVWNAADASADPSRLK